jgi:hypothetical protein
MEQFDKHIKDSFSNFEPEVNPAIWDTIKSQIPSAPAPSHPVSRFPTSIHPQQLRNPYIHPPE